MSKINDTSINDLSVPVNVKKILEKNGLTNVGKLMNFTGGELTSIHNIGEKRSQILERSLNEIGIDCRQKYSKKISKLNLPSGLKNTLIEKKYEEIEKFSGLSAETIYKICNMNDKWLLALLDVLNHEKIKYKKGDQLVFEMNISTRAKNILKRNNIYCRSQLLRVENSEIFEFRGAGEKIYHEIIQFQKGLSKA